MDRTLYKKSYEINSFLVNSQGKLGLYAILNILQDMAWGHANLLGIGNEAFSNQEMFWVLTRQKLKMDSWPKWGKSIEVHTWIRPGSGVFALREFEIFESDKKIGECSTEWVALSLKTRKFANYDGDTIFEKYKYNKSIETKSKKIPLIQNALLINEFNVRNSDIDVNQHVNNTKYAQWVLDALEVQKHTEYKLISYEVNFLSETKLGDTIEIIEDTEIINNDSISLFTFNGKRKQDNKVVFTARLEALKLNTLE